MIRQRELLDDMRRHRGELGSVPWVTWRSLLAWVLVAATIWAVTWMAHTGNGAVVAPEAVTLDRSW